MSSKVITIYDFFKFLGRQLFPSTVLKFGFELFFNASFRSNRNFFNQEVNII